MRETESQQLHVAGSPHHHVFRLDVAMDDPRRASDSEGSGYLRTDVRERFEGFAQGGPFGFAQGGLTDHRSQRLTLDQLHDDEMSRLRFANLVDGDDVRMIEGGGGTGFPGEALDDGWIVRVAIGQNLQRDIAVEPQVVGAVDFAHAT